MILNIFCSRLRSSVMRGTRPARRSVLTDKLENASHLKLENHPTVKRLYSPAQAKIEAGTASALHTDAASLRQLTFECGADDVGLVEITRPGLDPQCDETRAAEDFKADTVRWYLTNSEDVEETVR